MNTLLLLLGQRPWSARSSVSLLTKVFLAVSVFSVEMQAATWRGFGSIRSLAGVNAVLAALALWAWRPAAGAGVPPVAAASRVVPMAGVLALGALVLALNVAMPLEAADAYHLERMERIDRLGTLRYDPTSDSKLNMLSSIYEMELADVQQIPVLGPGLVRVHGVVGLALFLLAVGAAGELLGAREAWPWGVVVVVPVVFHQLVLVKNDLVVGVLGLVVLAWVVTRTRTAPLPEIVWASWLTGLAVTIKLTSLPVALVLLVAVAVQRRDGWRPLGAVVLGGALGALAGGLVFTLIENGRLYGTIMPSEDVGPRYAGPADVVTGVARFGVSLVDVGLLTRVWWPGRGGWGGTFGLPLVWAFVVVALRSREVPLARAALLCAGAHFVVFALALPDADVSQRLALAPGLLLVCVAAWLTAEEGGLRSRFGVALVPVMLLSGAQVIRSAFLYLTRS